MKKLYTTQNLRDLSFSRSHHRSSLFKVASLGTAVALFLSNASPVFSANLDLTKASLENVKNAAVVYPQSTLSAYNDYTSGMGGDNSTINVLTVDGRSVWKDAQNIFTVGGAVILDPEEYTEKGKSVAIDSTAHALGLGNIAIDAGYNNQDDNRDAFVNAYSLRVRADGDETVAIGSGPETRAYGKVILGDGSGTVSGFGMAGYDPFTKGLSGDDSHVWVGNAGIATIGNDKEKMARQLEGVAAGTYNTDAVNVAQLKSLQKYVDQGWNLSVGGENAKAVGIKDTVDLSAASGNLTIIKGEEDNNVKFDLAKNITVERVTAGRSSISDDGILFANGAGITVDGINAGNKQITGVAAGEEPEDAVNFAQLGKIENTVEGVTHNISQYFGGGADVFNGKAPSYTIQGKPHNGFESTFNAVDTSITNIQNQIANVAKNSLVKQEENESAITIGESTGGTEINVANKSGENRIISGVKAAVNANDAVNKEQLDGRIADISNSINNIEEGSAFAVLYDKKADGAVNYNSVSLGGDKTTAPVALRNVKDGKIIENSHDAINGSQLWETNDRVAGAEKDIIHINDKVTNISATVTDLGEEVFNIQKVGAFAVLYDKKADGAVNYNSVSLGGDKTTAPVALHNVKDGMIAQGSHDAINGSQIEKISRDVAVIFGGDAEFSEGILFGPHYHLSQISEDGVAITKDHNNVGDALTGLDDNINNVNSRLTHVANEFTQKIDGVSKDSLLWSNNEQAFVAQHGADKENSKIKFLANGDISANSTDAVNGSQLFVTNQNVTTVTNNLEKISQNTSQYFGGGADVSNGKAPTYTIQGKPHNGFESTFNAVDASITNIQNQITNATKNSLVKQEENEGAITIGESTGGIEINVANESGDARTISGVKAAEWSDEAVNKAQLDKSIEMISNDINLTRAAAVLYDKENGAINYGSVTLGGVDNQDPVALHNVKDGIIAQGSHDAINGNQINKISGDIANYFGGDASFENGAFKGPKYSLSVIDTDGQMAKANYYDVGSALTGLDANVKSVNTHLTNVVNDVNEKITNITQEVKGDALLWNGDEQAFVAQHGEGRTNSKIKFLANGDISANSTDAVNGSQLFVTNQNVTTVTNNLEKISQNTSQYFGGGADVSNGKAPTYTIQGKPHNGFESTFNAVDASITNIQNQITNATKNSLVKQEENEGAITIGESTGGIEINVANESGDARTISGVKAAEWSDEAVNKAQLDKSIEMISNDINLTRAAAVLYDKENGAINYGSVTLGGVDNQDPVALHNVKDGIIAQGSHDAINGNQINKISGDIANYFGGDASFENGAFKGPKYSLSVIVEDGQVAKANYHDVGSALTGLDANVKSVNTHLTNVVNDVNEKITNITQEVKGDALLWNSDEQAFVAQHGEGRTNSKIKFLANGDISANSTDAINGSQLYLMSNQLAAYFGGGAGYNNGEWTAPTFKIAQFKADGSSGEKKNYHNVASAFDGVSESMSKINDRIQNVENNVSSNGLNWNEQKKAYDASHDGQPSKIINVADGKIVEGSKDAVNGGQLWETNERITGVEKDIKHIENRVDNISTTVTNIGETVFNIEDRVDNIENTVNNLSDGAVNYDKDGEGNKTNRITLEGGDSSEPVLIDNVADGRIEKDSKEAVNGGQLHDYTQQQMKIVLDDAKKYTDSRVDNIVINAIDDAVDRSDRYTDMKFNILSYDIKSVRKEARQAAAVGLAVSNLRYFDEPGSLSVSFGSGTWRGQS
ncbi:Vomp family autotransporter, partial [Bartonella sp. CL74QHWL]|uniref:Vomp family autotransporter n=1 Tax=Bartonella sp. CL74QHWL TaxID=3243541 RepID=UPI0035CEFE7D